MTATKGNTAEKLVDGARQMIMLGGYNGFSYADLAQRYGIRKPSIHHHFPSKVDLVVAVVEQGRARIRTQISALEESSPIAMDQLPMYTSYWERCMKDQSALLPGRGAGCRAAEPPRPDRGGSARTLRRLRRVVAECAAPWRPAGIDAARICPRRWRPRTSWPRFTAQCS